MVTKLAEALLEILIRLGSEHIFKSLFKITVDMAGIFITHFKIYQPFRLILFSPPLFFRPSIADCTNGISTVACTGAGTTHLLTPRLGRTGVGWWLLAERSFPSCPVLAVVVGAEQRHRYSKSRMACQLAQHSECRVRRTDLRIAASGNGVESPRESCAAFVTF